jgi:hypothetical protein
LLLYMYPQRSTGAIESKSIGFYVETHEYLGWTIVQAEYHLNNDRRRVPQLEFFQRGAQTGQ